MKQEPELENKHHDDECLTSRGFMAESTTGADSYTRPPPAVTTEFLSGHDLYLTEHRKQCPVPSA